jgi:hypothetical protein
LKEFFISDKIFERLAYCGFPALLLIFSVIHTGCGQLDRSVINSGTETSSAGTENLFNPRNQLYTSDFIYSSQLFRKGNSQSAPIIRLNSEEQLQLRFETLGFNSRQFRIRFTHHNPDWSGSPLGPEQFIEGFSTTTLSGGDLSRERQPSYRQFTYDFPNRDISFRYSGNYMILVEDQETGRLLFNMPFFVYENEGLIRTSVEQQVTPRQDLRTTHFPVSRYEYPDFIDQPQFDLEFYYVQNRFWGRMRLSDELDFSSPDHVQFELRRENGFTGDYEFRWLSLTEISQRLPQIAEIDLTSRIPLVLLNDDSEGFSNQPPRNLNGRSGIPGHDLSSRYADVVFSLDTEQEIPADAEIHILGDFNNWSLQSDSEMRYRSDIDRWQGSALMKTGSYHYKYILLKDNRIDDLYFDSRFSFNRQEYHTLIYMRDQSLQAYRLLQVNHLFSDSY